jgi:predicted cation transporter
MVMVVGLIVIAVVVAFLPLFVKRAGENIEVFLFLMGAAAVTVTSRWSAALLLDALEGPLGIAIAVLLASLLFHFIQGPLERRITWLRARMGSGVLVVLIVAVAGLVSSFLTAVIASLVMVETMSRLKLDRKTETRVVVLACFSIGLGSALTPFGGPLSAVVFSKLLGEPYHADTWFLFRSLWMYVIPGIILLSASSLLLTGTRSAAEAPVPREEKETIGSAVVRAARIYVFVAGLIFFGAGFTPTVTRFIGSVPPLALFWANITSAVFDNAALAAAEIVPSMQMHQLVAALMGLLIAGGILVPGNIPNIIAAGRLRIHSGEWARIGAPVGLVMMMAMFGVLLLTG